MIFRFSRTLFLLVAIGLGGAFAPTARTAEKSRDYLVRVWQTDDGLPQNWVSSIAQTPDGYLWIGTRYGGLTRFDGIRFVRFTPQNTPELRDVQVERLSVDTEGTLWIAMGNRSVTTLRRGRFELVRLPRTEPQVRLEGILETTPAKTYFVAERGEIAVVDRAQGTGGWEVLRPAPAAKAYSYSVYPAETFRRDRAGDLWYVDQNHQLGRFSVDGNREVPAELRFPGARVTALTSDRDGTLWIATSDRILSWDGRTRRDHTPTDPAGLSGVREIALGGDGSLWVFEPQRLRKLRGGTWTTVAASERLKASVSSRHFKLAGDSAGGAWIASYGHGLFHARADGTTRQLTEREGLPSDLVTCWFEDNEGNIWIGTAGGGIARIRERIFHLLGTSDGLPEKVVRSVAVAPDGAVWAGTMLGQLARWQDERWTMLPLPPIEATPLSGLTVLPSRAGGVWIGSLNHGLMRFENGRMSRPAGVTDPWFIRAFFEDSRGALWIGGLGDLRRYAAGILKGFGPEEGFPSGIGVNAIAEDAAGALWLGTGPGELWRFKDNAFTCFRPPPEWRPAQLVALHADQNGVVWIGTLGGGLLRFENGSFSRFRTGDGLTDDNVTQLLDNGAGELWGGTYAGIFHVKKSDLHDYAAGRVGRLACSSYDRADGLPALECTSGFNPACWRATDGRLWFSTVNGLVSVNPARVSRNTRPPDVLIEELLLDGGLRVLDADQQAGRTPLTIGPGRHFLQFRFTGLSFSAPDQVRFRWKLEGVERDWQDSGTQRVIGLGPLTPGSYRLHVRAANADGVWNDGGAALAFTVLPYFWETIWFKTLLALGVLAALVAGVTVAQRRRYRRRLDEMERQREVERERTRIARDLHDDLGTSLTQISLLSALANREQTSSAEARELVHQVHGRAREMVTALDEIVWAVNPKNDTWLELASYLGHFAAEFFRPSGIRCRLDIPEQLPAQPLSAELRHHLFLAFKEALNNAARHSHAAHVWVRLEVRSDAVILSVEDDGRGFAEALPPARRAGNGLTNMRRRMEQVGGSADVKTNPGVGTVVSLRVPLG